MLKTNFNKSSGNSKEDTFDIRRIIINNEGSGSRVNQAEKFKANQQEKFRAISTNIQSQLAKKINKKIQTISSECGRTPIEGCNPRKILKWIEKSNADFISRKHLTS